MNYLDIFLSRSQWTSWHDILCDVSLWFFSNLLRTVLWWCVNASRWIILVFWQMSHKDLSLCSAGSLIVNYLGILFGIWWWIISLCCWMTYGELCRYFVGCLMASNSVFCQMSHSTLFWYMLDVSQRIMLVFCQMSQGTLTWYFVWCLTVNYFSILSDVRWRNMLVFCLMSQGEFSRYSVRCLTVNYWYFVRCLTVNYFDILLDVSWWIISVFIWMPDCKLCLYFVGCLMVNFLGMVSEILKQQSN